MYKKIKMDKAQVQKILESMPKKEAEYFLDSIKGDMTKKAVAELEKKVSRKWKTRSCRGKGKA